jgi:WD40 repeat protein
VVITEISFQLFDVTKLNENPKPVESRGDLDSLAVCPDGRIAAGAYDDGTVRLWDLATLQPKDAFKGFLLGAHSVAFSPDGQRLAAGSNGQEAIKLWETETWHELLTLSGEGSVFEGLKFSPDGRYLLAINSGGLTQLWYAPSLDEIAAAEAKAGWQ